MDTKYVIRGRVVHAQDRNLQDALARIYDSPERPRCLCVPGGIDMYIAKHGEYVVKRMPGTGQLHHPSCDSFEPDAGESGLGELMGQAIVVSGPESVELKIDFPLTRTVGKTTPRSEPGPQPAVVKGSPKRASLRALLHLLYDRAQFNRWYPNMEGKRTWGVMHRYLNQAAKGVTINGLNLEERLFVPEPFRVADADAIGQRRRRKLSILQVPEAGATFKMAVVVGQLASMEQDDKGMRLILKHMPDVHFFLDERVGKKTLKAYEPILEAPMADVLPRPRIMVAAVIYARRELTYEIAALTMMLTSDQWIPLEGLHEVELVEALQKQGRSFYKPLQFDAKSSAPFMNVKLLDTFEPVPMHVLSGFSEPKDREAKLKAIADCEFEPWVWSTSEPMPPLPRVGSAPVRRDPTARRATGSTTAERTASTRGAVNTVSQGLGAGVEGVAGVERGDGAPGDQGAKMPSEAAGLDRMHESALAALQSGPSMAEQEDAHHEPYEGPEEDWHGYSATEP